MQNANRIIEEVFEVSPSKEPVKPDKENEETGENIELMISDLDKEMDSINERVMTRIRGLKEKLTTIRNQKRTYLQFNVINNVSMPKNN